ncbi:MAG: hypothetical protein RBU27_00595 [Bacteroidota bacterium]|jgi:hypothetical protein|nr:hypothetical protein [Bacteroidota bacterium]
MQHSELLHRFFDEGLDEPLEDVLFGQMALDPELRREFVSHLKLHTIIQEDVAGITTPSHVSRQLFASLGLGLPEAPLPEPAFGLRDSAGAAWARLRTLVAAHRRELSVGVFSALATALLLMQFTVRDVPILRPIPVAMESRVQEAPVTEPAPSLQESRSLTTGAASRVTSPDASVTSPDAFVTAPDVASPDGNGTAPGVASPDGSIAAFMPPTADAGMVPMVNNGSAIAVSNEGVTVADIPDAVAIERIPSPADGAREPDGETARLPFGDVVIAELPVIDPPWQFTQPGPRENIFSNLIFELRRLYGRSYPEVDQQHNSFNVFENMAISVVSKTTEHHAFGLEYGRENFGREFHRSAEPQVPLLSFADPSSAEVYRPPAQAVAGPQRENRMLDVVGAVWKLSLPEYGMFDLVYPYLRTLVGATKLGPVGKVRAGLEMYPSNYSMLNVGIEGGMLRYMVDDIPYYTAKLNFTFGVALAF